MFLYPNHILLFFFTLTFQSPYYCPLVEVVDCVGGLKDTYIEFWYPLITVLHFIIPSSLLRRTVKQYKYRKKGLITIRETY